MHIKIRYRCWYCNCVRGTVLPVLCSRMHLCCIRVAKKHQLVIIFVLQAFHSFLSFVLMLFWFIRPIVSIKNAIQRSFSTLLKTIIQAFIGNALLGHSTGNNFYIKLLISCLLTIFLFLQKTNLPISRLIGFFYRIRYEKTDKYDEYIIRRRKTKRNGEKRRK